MNGSADGRPPGLPRWLLLVALVLGITGMHTLGHLASGHGADDMSGVSRHGALAQPQFVHSADPGTDISSKNGEPQGLDPASVCLAVLTGLLVLSLASWSRLGWAPLTGGSGVSYSRVTRPPPQRTALAGLSVLRI
ncbi:hypothetical protein Aple_032010 [Acrocarpospora pleiomorpha]|uniref:Uncharacterized protein n=1 Tax=Acrocarpospora pleiomorpha TaxID=90975 RepID=A0A5M3XFD9_9ACTN|nr:DUF6153 family protein [Acrocarpospora pleiomorpha]GES20305.1 hypothetical protein Aple_032010 [Acrocarpospora pleiomorpha]